jgi:hypothetical protein
MRLIEKVKQFLPMIGLKAIQLLVRHQLLIKYGLLSQEQIPELIDV